MRASESPFLKYLRNFDWILLGSVLALITYGIVLIHSASQVVDQTGAGLLDMPPVRQAIYAVIGLGILALFALLDYRLYRRIAWILYGFLVLSLIAVLLVGDSNYGARRWIELPFIQFQPSEFGKVILIIVLATIIGKDDRRIQSLPVFLLTGVVTAVPMALIMLGPDLGTTAMYGIIWLAIVTVAGARLWHLALVILPAVAFAVLGFMTFFPAYQKARLLTFLDPAADALGEGYNILQAEISIGSGGLLGKGLLEGTQSQLHFLRIQRTDFIFSVLGEELGFIGAMLLFSLFLIFVLRGVRTAWQAPDSFGRLVAVGIVAMIVAQAFINIGANVRLLPMTGIPLPFISAGGTSLLSKMFAIGVLESIAIRRRKPDAPMPIGDPVPRLVMPERVPRRPLGQGYYGAPLSRRR